MADVLRYCELKTQAQELFSALTKVRKEINAFELQVIERAKQTQQSLVSVVVQNRQAVIRVHNRSRRLPLTEEDLRLKLCKCLVERFKNVDSDELSKFSFALARRIWSERRTKNEPKVTMKLSNPLIG
jgi:hypothetical protein